MLRARHWADWASEVAKRLRGKHKTNFTPHADCGDFVIVVNAEKVVLTGNKWDSKEYIRYTGYPSGQRKRTAREQMKRKPFAMVEDAVRGMLPKNLWDAKFSETCTLLWARTTNTKLSNLRHSH